MRNVHIGRLVELDVEDPGQLTAMCEQLLANPLVEDFEIQRPQAGGSSPEAVAGDPRG